jgi:predicted glycosyltransferase
MKYLFYLGHPSHYHVHKSTIRRLKKEHTVFTLIKQKDILENLVEQSGWDYENILPEGRKDNKFDIFRGLAKRTWRMLIYCKNNQPDILIGTSAEITYVGKILGIPSIVVNEDDVSVVPLFANLAYPFATAILSPQSCDLGKWEKKGKKYPGYQKLTYLHPNQFIPNQAVISSLYGNRDKYFLLRFSKLSAHHDFGMAGISNEAAIQLVEFLGKHGTVWISSERELPEALKTYQLTLDINQIHHALGFAHLFISDSQSMTVEAAMLGTPSIRYSDFVGKINVLEELEHQYHLTIGIMPPDIEGLLATAMQMVKQENLVTEWQSRRAKMLSEVIDVSEYFYQVISTYPSTHTP